MRLFQALIPGRGWEQNKRRKMEIWTVLEKKNSKGLGFFCVVGLRKYFSSLCPDPYQILGPTSSRLANPGEFSLRH